VHTPENYSGVPYVSELMHDYGKII
jgi:hypothetical protein